MARGKFITLEGGEGVGKSTLARALADLLSARGATCVVTREPGGSPGAELLREVLYGPASPHWAPMPETLLLYAARAAHLDETVRPALARGDWVICDRFNDSTVAYQGAAGGVPRATLDALAGIVIGGDMPDLTLILDLDPAQARLRAESRGEPLTRYDSSSPAFHATLRAAFRAIAAAEPARCKMLNAGVAPAALADAAMAVISAQFSAELAATT
jgi:dTMP kinase